MLDGAISGDRKVLFRLMREQSSGGEERQKSQDGGGLVIIQGDYG